MKKWWVLVLAVVVLLTAMGGGAALPYGREMEDMALMGTMGMDIEGDQVRVTASSTVQSGETKPPAVLSAVSATASGACLTMQTYGEAYVFFGHVGQLLLGEDMARQRLDQALRYVERDPEMRLDTALFIVREAPAGETIFTLTGEDSSAPRRLEAIENDAGMAGAPQTRRVGEVLSALERNGAAFAPALTLKTAEEGDGAQAGVNLTADGYAILKPEGLVGWAQGDAAAGVDLIMGTVSADLLETPGPDGEPAALRVVGVKTGVSPIFREGRLTGLAVDCAVEANLAQGPVELTQGEIDALTRALEEIEAGRIRAALDLSQTLNGDFLGLKKRAGLAAPWHWGKLRSQWEAAFPHLEVQLTVTGTLQRSYDIVK